MESNIHPERLDARKIVTPDHVIIDGRRATIYIQKITIPGTSDVVSEVIHIIPKDTEKTRFELEHDPDDKAIKDPTLKNPIRVVDLSGREWSYMRIPGTWEKIQTNPRFNVNKPRVLRDALCEYNKRRTAKDKEADPETSEDEQKASCKCTDF